ncbi:MAG: Gfo/Idh/MocA family oxidoreductase [Acidobacteria bacterium]|nr:Gfo/Idh/MocA family oxidoreductase [Acidobacteriota bacterium]
MRPRVGFLGLGWIGRHRLQALAGADLVDVIALCDPYAASLDGAARCAPHARHVETLEALLDEKLDAVVIATPSALHAAQAIRCFEHGVAVFCQKPLARSSDEAAAVIRAACSADRLLGVDMCYRHTAAVRAIKQLIQDESLGSIYAADLVFHNAYGPGKDWYYASALAGGGCFMDLGIHLVDQVLWLLGWSTVRVVDTRLFHQGERWCREAGRVEDFAHIVLEGPRGAVARLACSWRAPAGCDARIGTELFGTAGGARVSNVNGSFYDFAAERRDGTSATTLASPPDEWGGRAIVNWARDLARGGTYHASAAHHVTLAGIVDQVYAHAERDTRESSLPAYIVG